MYRSVLAAILAVASLALLAACGGSGSSGGTPTPTPASGTPTATNQPEFDAEAYFRGKTINIIDGFSPGGGSDTAFRIFALVAEKYFPGNPTIVIQNLPGSGGLRGVQHVVRAAPDGLTIGGTHARWPKRAVAGIEVEGFDPFSVRWVGRVYETLSEPALYVRRSVATSWQEVLDKGITLRYGATEPGHGGDLAATFIQQTGGPVSITYGYGGSAEVLAAIDREELDATGFASESFVRRLYPEWLEERFVVPILWWGTPHRQEYLDALGAPEPPYVFDVIEAEEWQQQTFEMANDFDRISMSFFLPEDTPDHIYQVWLDVFDKVVHDQEFIDRKIEANLEATYVTAEEVERILVETKQLLDGNPQALDMFRSLLGVD